jgi:hypothetical protein
VIQKILACTFVLLWRPTASEPTSTGSCQSLTLPCSNSKTRFQAEVIGALSAEFYEVVMLKEEP